MGGFRIESGSGGGDLADVLPPATAAATSHRPLVVALHPSSPLALPTGGATSAKQDTGNASLASIDSKLANPMPVSGVFWQTTQPVSVASLPLPAGAATSAKQDTGNASLASIDTKLTNPLPVSAASLPLPAGAATETTLGTRLADATFTARINTQGQKTMSASTPVVVASDQAPFPVSHPADTTPATQTITVVDSATTTTGGANSQSIFTGTPTAGSSATFALTSWQTAFFQISGTWTGTIQIEVSVDGGTTYYIRSGHQPGTAIQAAAFTANFSATVNVAGCSHVRIRAIAAMTGTVTVRCVESYGTSVGYVANALRIADAAGNFFPASDVPARALSAKLTDGTATVGTLVDGSGVAGLMVALGATNFPLSTANSTTTQLAASATFTGTIETIYNEQVISLLMTSDQPGTLTINQYIDAAGLRKASTMTISVTANVGVSRSIVANGNYFNLTFQNTGGSTTTTLNINVAFGILPIQTQLGNQPVSISEINGAVPSALVPAGTLPAGITDGVRGPATVKAAGVSTTTSDLALTVGLSPNSSGPFSFGGDNRLRVGQESLLFVDTFEGAAVNTVLWTQSQLTMTQTVASGGVTLNANSTLTSGTYSILSSTKLIRSLVEQALYFQFRNRVIPQTNAVVEFGWGAVATTSAPTNGCLFRVPSSGVLQAVINYGGSETVTQLATAGTLSSSNYYGFEIFAFEDSVLFEVSAPDGSIMISQSVPIPNANASAVTVSTLSVFGRVYTTGATSSAAQLIMGNVIATQLDSGPAMYEASNVFSIASANTNTNLFTANPMRVSASIFNDSTSAMYVKFGTTASATSHKVKIAAGGYYEFPLMPNGRVWQGNVDAIWVTANGSARCSEEF